MQVTVQHNQEKGTYDVLTACKGKWQVVQSFQRAKEAQELEKKLVKEKAGK